MSKNNFSTLDDYPLVLRVEDLANITGLGKNSCYQMCKTDGFPAFKPPGRSIYLIPRDSFFNWLEENASSSNNKLQ